MALSLGLGLGLSFARSGGGVPSWTPPDALFAIETVPGGRRYQCGAPVNVNATGGYALSNARLYVPIAADTPRMTDRGLLVEAARENAVRGNMLNSLSTYIMLTDTTRASLAAGGSPAGDAYAKRITQGSAGNGVHSFFGTGWVTAGQQNACSVVLRSPDSARYIRVSMSDNVSVVHQLWVDLETKTIGNVSSGAQGSVVPLDDDWMLVTLITGLYPNTTSSGGLGFIVCNGMGSTTRATGHYDMWGGQVELNRSGVSSPILTGTNTAVRAADTLIIPNVSAGAYNLHLQYAGGADRVIAGWAYNDPLPFDPRPIIMAWGEAA